jgi:hypothetical protein
MYAVMEREWIEPTDERMCVAGLCMHEIVKLPSMHTPVCQKSARKCDALITSAESDIARSGFGIMMQKQFKLRCLPQGYYQRKGNPTANQ